MVAASGPKIRASAGSPGRAWRPARRRCGAARRERPPAAVAVRRRWQVLRRRYRPRRGRTGRYRSRRRAAARQQQRGDGEVLVVIDGHGPVLRSGGAGPSGPCRGCVQPNICRTSCPGPHCSNPLRIRRWGRSATSRQGAPAYAWALTEGGARGGSSPAAGPIGAAADPAPPVRAQRPWGSAAGASGDILPLLRISPSCRVPYPPPFPFPRLPTTWPRCAATWIRRPRRPRPAAVHLGRHQGQCLRPRHRTGGGGVLLGAGAGDAGPGRGGAAARPAGAVRSCCWRVSSNPPTWTSSTAIT